MLSGHRSAWRRRGRNSRAARIAVPLAIPMALGLTLGIILAVSGGPVTTINQSATGLRLAIGEPLGQPRALGEPRALRQHRGRRQCLGVSHPLPLGERERQWECQWERQPGRRGRGRSAGGDLRQRADRFLPAR